MRKSIEAIGNQGAFASWIVSKPVFVHRGGAPSDCQIRVERDIDARSPEWLKLERVLQNIKGKGIATMLGAIEDEKVVIKAQSAKDARAEFDVQRRLRDMQGFVSFHCIFFCSGNKEYIERFGTLDEQTKLCRARGDEMGVIVMPYFTHGSFESYLRQGRPRIDVVKKVLCTVIETVFRAFTAVGFTHGDLFPKNIVLDANMRPAVLDFEKSEFAASAMRFWRDIDDLLGEVARFAMKNVLDSASRVIFVHLAYGALPNESNVNDLCRAIMSS
jgi:serine/threonine protein kinase